MVDEKYLQMAITIRRTYLKLINNLDLYRSRALQISDKLEETLVKLNEFNKEISEGSKNQNKVEIFEKLLKIIDDVEDEGKRLENLINPINVEIEKLSKEEMELYKQIVDSHPSLTEDQIIESVRDRLINEGLS